MTRAEAITYRNKIEAAASTMTDEVALTAVELFPAWTAGKAYAVGAVQMRAGAHQSGGLDTGRDPSAVGRC